jgi:hypothetical protein
MNGVALSALKLAMLQAIDEAERERIRHALKRYKALHGSIGDPLLCERIEEAIKLPVRLSTLQRFLKGKHRTDDIAVHRLRKFLTMVAPPAAEDDLGKALSNFLPFQRKNADAHAAMAGIYTTRTQPHAGLPGGRNPHFPTWSTDLGCRPACTMNWSRIELRPDTDPIFLRATELVFDPELKHPGKLQFTAGLGNTGLFVPIGYAEYLMMVRSFIDARIYLLTRQPGDPLTLRGIVYQSAGAVFSISSHNQPALEIEMTKDAPSAEGDKESA